MDSNSKPQKIVRNLAKESLNRPVRAIAPLPAPTPEELLGFRKSHLAELVKKAYNSGFLPKVEWTRAQLWINGLEEHQVQSQIDYYSRLIASKETSKAA